MAIQLASQHRITAAVALAGASIIAVTPVAPPLPAVEVPLVQLTAGEDPITAWEDVFQTASANATAIFDEWSASPFPVLQQIIANQIGYLGELPDLQTIFGQISDNVLAATREPFSADFGALDSGHLDALQDLPASLFPQELLTSLITPLSLSSGVLLGALGPVVSPILALENSVQEILAELFGANPDPTAALDDLINIPAAVTGAFLNGYGDIDITSLLPLLSEFVPGSLTINSLDNALGGLFSPGGSLFDALGIDATFDPLGYIYDLWGSPVGAIGSLVDLSQAIAGAIGWSGTGDPLTEILSSLF